MVNQQREFDEPMHMGSMRDERVTGFDLLITLLFGLVLALRAASAPATEWYVANAQQGDGTCLTNATHANTFAVCKMKAIAPGDTIWLSDGNTEAGHGTTYKGADNMINCLTAPACTWHGTADKKITIRATNLPDRTGFYVKIDGEGIRNPILLYNQAFVRVIGLEAMRPTAAGDAAPCAMGGSMRNKNNTFEKMACHDAGIDNNGPGIRFYHGSNNAAIDTVEFGTFRKCMEFIGTTAPYSERNICIHAGSIMTAGVNLVDPLYGSSNAIVQDGLNFVTGSAMPSLYRLMGFRGCQYCSPNPPKGTQPGAPPYACANPGGCLGTELKNFDYCNTGCANYSVGHTNGSGAAGGEMLGNITIIRARDRGRLLNGMMFANYDNLTLQDNIMVLGACAKCSVSKGYTLNNCSTNCSSPVNLFFTNNTAIAPAVSSIGSQWTSTNFHSVTSRTTEDFYHGAHSAVGANVCFLYKRGALTAQKRWTAYDNMIPALMAAMTQAGYPALDPKSEVYDAIGQAPSDCGGPVPTPTLIPTATRTPTAALTFASP
jgi:hypothetical protein